MSRLREEWRVRNQRNSLHTHIDTYTHSYRHTQKQIPTHRRNVRTRKLFAGTLTQIVEKSPTETPVTDTFSFLFSSYMSPSWTRLYIRVPSGVGWGTLETSILLELQGSTRSSGPGVMEVLVGDLRSKGPSLHWTRSVRGKGVDSWLKTVMVVVPFIQGVMITVYTHHVGSQVMFLTHKPTQNSHNYIQTYRQPHTYIDTHTGIYRTDTSQRERT